MKNLTILVDMDDTIENLLESWLHVLNVEYGYYVTPNDVAEWNLTEAYPDLTPWQVYAPLFRDELWQDVKPKWDAVKYLKMLCDDGHNIYITTSSNFRTINTKVNAVLHRYFPFIDDDHVIVATKKQMLKGDVMIDDAPHNLAGGDYEKILVSAPHNRGYNAELWGMKRVISWSEIYDIICDMAGNPDLSEP